MTTKEMILKKAFAEIQLKKLETTKKINILNIKCDTVSMGKRKYELTEEGTSDLPEDSRVYLAVGRMFLLSDIPEMHNQLKSQKTRCDMTIEYFQKEKETLQKSFKEREDNLRKLVQKLQHGDATK